MKRANYADILAKRDSEKETTAAEAGVVYAGQVKKRRRRLTKRKNSALLVSGKHGGASRGTTMAKRRRRMSAAQRRAALKNLRKARRARKGGSAPKRRRRRRHQKEAAAPVRRRRRRARRARKAPRRRRRHARKVYVRRRHGRGMRALHETPKRRRRRRHSRRRHHARAHRRSRRVMENPLGAAEVMMGGFTMLLGLGAADVVDRMLATHPLVATTGTTPVYTDPNAMPVTASGQTLSNGAGVLAPMNAKRWAAGAAITVLPFVAAGMVRSAMWRSALQLFGFGAGARVLGKAAKDGVAYLLRNNQYAQRLYVAELNAGLENAVSAGNSTSGYLTATSKPAGFYGGGTGLGRTGVGCNGMGGCGGTCGGGCGYGWGSATNNTGLPLPPPQPGGGALNPPAPPGTIPGFSPQPGIPSSVPTGVVPGAMPAQGQGPTPVSVPGQVVGVQPQTPHIPGYVSLPGGGGVKPSFNLPAGFNFRGGGGAPTNAPNPTGTAKPFNFLARHHEADHDDN